MKVVIDMFVEFASALAFHRDEAISIPRAAIVSGIFLYMLRTIAE
jgi:hypothetical protein